MASIGLQDGQFSYDTEGDGFPLVLAPASPGVWAAYMPLLGELCRVIAYVHHEPAEAPRRVVSDASAHAAAMLRTFLDTLGLERVYLASQAVGWSMALHFALHYPGRLEGLMLLGAHAMAIADMEVLRACEARLHEITVPTLVLLEAEAVTALSYADILAERLPRCTRVVVTGAAPLPTPGASALQLAHTMMRFLLHCERQRHLVRGASFLL